MRLTFPNRSSAAAVLLAAGLISAASLSASPRALAHSGAMGKDTAEQSQSIPAAKRAWLGVRVQSIDADTALALGRTEAKGALITELMPDGPAAAAGLKVSDAVLALNGQAVADGRDLARQIAGLQPDASAEFKILRGDSEQTITVKLAASKETAQTAPAPAQDAKTMPRLGLRLAPAPQDGGVLIAHVDPNSDAARKGLTSGNVILEVDGTRVASAAEVVDSLKAVHGKGRKAVLLVVKSGSETRTVPVRFHVMG